jgi:signal transduction histidine kinase
MLTIFLLLFNIIVYSLFSFIINKEERTDIKLLAKQEATVIRDYVMDNREMNYLEMDNQSIIMAGNDQFFYYLIGAKGQLLGGDEVFGSLRPELLRLVQHWKPRSNEIRYETLQIDNRQQGRGFGRRFQPAGGRDIRLMMTARSITISKQFVGTLYIGKNISSHSELFQWLIFILVGLTVIFSSCALWVGRLMSKRAMVPIIQSYTRHREFVADASHELRTPLSVLLSSLDALELEEGEHDEFSGRVMSNMKDEVKRMTHLVGDLLTIARSDSGKIELQKDLFDIYTYVEKTIEAMEPLASAKNISIHLQAQDQITMYGDAEKIRQLLYILLDNAIKYSPEYGKVRVELTATYAERNGMLQLSVEDTGPGIKPEDYDRIFDRFYRADKSRSRQVGGHGLGLAIAKWIVEAHVGTITVSSSQSGGSRFIIRIPLMSVSKS